MRHPDNNTDHHIIISSSALSHAASAPSMDQPSGEHYNAHPLAESLVAWFTSNGGRLSPDVQIVYNQARGFHMRALRPLSSPVVTTCPLKLTLSCLNLDPSEEGVLHIQSPLRQCRGRIPDHILTYLLLIEQRDKGQASPWHTYIACLPSSDSMTTPLWFDEGDMAFLAGTSLAPAAKERKAELYQQWERAMAVIEELGIALVKHVDLESLLWAATIFTSRAFISTHILPGRETVPILFPVVDILNHSVSARVEWDFEPSQSFALKCLDGDSFQPGQELFNNYAPKQNDELLLGYGFCLEDNPIEQFVLKLAFQPELQQRAQQMGLLNPENVPFGMSKAFLATDPNKEQHFLRAKDHPFGRYNNHVPFFRGVPPYIVHFFFIQTIMTLETDLSGVDFEKPGPRITLQVLILLHRALAQRCSTLPLVLQREPQNDKQRFAKIYRDTQARIIHSVENELQAAVTRLRSPNDRNARSLHCLRNVFAIFCSDFPKPFKRFEKALEQHGLQHGCEGQSMVWTLLLTVLLATMLTTQKNTNDTPTFALLRDLCARHALPTLEDGIEDVEMYTFIDEHLGDFLRLPSSTDPDASPSDILDELGLAFVNQPAENTAPVFITGRTENLGPRIIMWAMKVVERDAVPIFEDEQVKTCLYARFQAEEGDVQSDERWMYEDVEI
ncbi:set domain [Pyrenophora seminiperda CCB06]|uniref:Set domain n=1 Tax=Pyrenophora seminiperda CCB06 TaxID=1302712 RepID=A0A3M7MH96_9PLEO|nr:set domain [Pyrenophora seminiperda CCB06]